MSNNDTWIDVCLSNSSHLTFLMIGHVKDQAGVMWWYDGSKNEREVAWSQLQLGSLTKFIKKKYWVFEKLNNSLRILYDSFTFCLNSFVSTSVAHCFFVQTVKMNKIKSNQSLMAMPPFASYVCAWAGV